MDQYIYKCDNCGMENPPLINDGRLTLCCSTYDITHRNAFYNTVDSRGLTVYSMGKLTKDLELSTRPQTEHSMKIGLDFDQTLAEVNFPTILNEVPGASMVCTELVEAGHNLILTTMRSNKRDGQAPDNAPGFVAEWGPHLDAALMWCGQHGIELYAYNHDPGQELWTDSPKCYCDLLIDDVALGIPLMKGLVSKKNMVNWLLVYQMLCTRGILHQNPFVFRALEQQQRAYVMKYNRANKLTNG